MFGFGRKKLHSKPSYAAGMNGFGAPLHIAYGTTQAPGTVDNAGYHPYLTLLLPRYTPIGGGIQNQRDIGTAPPVWSKQGVGLTRVGDPGILAGAFVSGPLTNTSAQNVASGITALQPAGSWELPQP